VLRVSTDKVVNLPQSLRKRFRLSAAFVIYKAESGEPERAHFGPLLVISLFRHFEGAPHRMEFGATFRARANGFIGQLP